MVELVTKKKVIYTALFFVVVFLVGFSIGLWTPQSCPETICVEKECPSLECPSLTCPDCVCEAPPVTAVTSELVPMVHQVNQDYKQPRYRYEAKVEKKKFCNGTRVATIQHAPYINMCRKDNGDFDNTHNAGIDACCRLHVHGSYCGIVGDPIIRPSGLEDFDWKELHCYKVNASA